MVPNPDQIYEFACHEGNYSMPVILAGALNTEQQPSDVKELQRRVDLLADEVERLRSGEKEASERSR